MEVYCLSSVKNFPLLKTDAGNGPSNFMICQSKISKQVRILKMPVLLKKAFQCIYLKLYKGITMITCFLAFQIRKSENLAWNRNSYLTHVISLQKDNFHLNSVCTGCIGRHATLLLGSHHSIATSLWCRFKKWSISLCVVMNLLLK